MATATNLTGFETRCPNCAASISYNPEDVIITCEFCGVIVNQKGESIPNHYMLPNNLKSDDLISMIQNWLPAHSRIKKNIIALSSVRPLLIPYWAIQVKAHSNFVGYIRATDYREEQRTRTVRNNDGSTSQQTYTERIPVTVYRPVEKEINENRRRVLLSRQGALFFGQKNLEKVLDTEIAQAKEFDIEMVKELGKEVKFLSGEIEDSDAREIISSTVKADHRAQAHKDTTELFDCRTQVWLEDSYFVHYPFWLIEYTYEGKSYRVAFDGYKKEILKGETPVTSFTRVINFISTVVIAGLASVILVILDFEHAATAISKNIYLGGAVVIGIVGYLVSIYLYSRVFMVTGVKND